MLTHDRLLSELYYDASTGAFVWKTGRKGRKKNKAAGFLMKNGYIGICIDGQQYYAHRLAWYYLYGNWPKFTIDHRNGFRSDNRLCNLRDVPHINNCQNIVKPQSHNKTGYRGVSFHKQTGRYEAKICVDKRPIFLGLHDTPELAAQAYATAKARFHISG